MPTSGMAARTPRRLIGRIRPAHGLLGLLLAASVACTSQAVSEPPGPNPFAGLPAGDGRDILVNQCLNCHELDALELFRGFYNRQRWRSLVVTMRANGAQVDDREVDILASYLARNFGTGID